MQQLIILLRWREIYNFSTFKPPSTVILFVKVTMVEVNGFLGYQYTNEDSRQGMICASILELQHLPL